MTSSNEPGSSPAGMIPLSVPVIRGNEWEYVKQCLDSEWVSSVGEFVTRFESMMAALTGTGNAVATVNGTAAIHASLLAAGVQPDDEVLVSDLTFIAPVNAIRYANAWPVLIDAEPEHWQMDVQQVKRFLEEDCERREGGTFNRTTGRRVSAVVPVHILGHPVDLDPLLELAGEFGLTVIEDATESLGSRYKEQPTGSRSPLNCFSYNGNKIITTGGGGMVATSDTKLADRVRYLTTQAKDDPIEYRHEEVGFNYRLTNVQAAIGVAQLEQLEEYLAAKRRISKRYREAFADLPGITPQPIADHAEPNHWLFTVLVDEGVFGMDSRALMHHLETEKIQTRPLWTPMHQTVHRQWCGAGEWPVAERLHHDALSLPCSVNLSESDQERVIEAVITIHSSS